MIEIEQDHHKHRETEFSQIPDLLCNIDGPVIILHNKLGIWLNSVSAAIHPILSISII